MTAPPVLLPYQQRWLADPAPVRVAEKSRRVGLSWAQASESALLAAADRGMDTWYIGYTLDMAQEFIRDAGAWAKAFNLAAGEMQECVFEEEGEDGETKAIKAYRIDFASGHRVTALSSRPRNLRGKQGLVVIDEAAFHEDLEGLIKAAIALLMWGGRVAIISTHDGADNPFNELVGEIRAKKRPYSLHRITLDDALAEGLYERICLASKGTARPLDPSPEARAKWRQELIDSYGSHADEELFCVPSNSAGTYFSRALLESRMVQAPVLRFRCDPGFEQSPDQVRRADTQDWLEANLKPLLADLKPAWRSYYGMDFGRTGDLSVIAPVLEDQGLVRRVPFMVELRNVPFRQQEQILFYLVDRLPRFLAGAHDARGNGQYLAEIAAQRYGFSRIDQIMLTADWYRDNFPRLRADFEDGNLLIPKDADVLGDLRAVVVERGVPRVPEKAHTKGADGGQRHGDAAIALVLADYAVATAPAPIEYQTVGTTRESASLGDYRCM